MSEQALLADDGAVLPRVAGRPVPEAALRPSDSELGLSVRLDMVVRSDGMQVAITDYVIPLHWRAGVWTAIPTRQTGLQPIHPNRTDSSCIWYVGTYFVVSFICFPLSL